MGKETLRELHLRRDRPPELILDTKRAWLRQPANQQDLDFCINAGSRYSPWAAASVSQGFLTAEGGHRIGICGESVVQNGKITGIRKVSSLCIRVARDFPGVGKKAGELSGSVLILGAPGWGKTTLLRDLIRIRSRRETVAVVDERGELFPEGFDTGPQTDVLKSCPKAQGILQLLKTMGPQTIAVDEITSEADCAAICRSSRCGVSLLASAHGTSLEELRNHRLYGPVLEETVFDNVVILRKDQTYQVERMSV